MDTIVLVLIVVIFLIVALKKLTDDPLWHQLPGPDYKLPLLGAYYDIINSDISSYHTKWAHEYGSIYRYYVFGKIRVAVTDPELVKYILLNNHLFDKDLFPYHALGTLLGRGLVTQVDEGIHKAHKKIILPAFAHRHLRAMVPIFQRKATLLVEDLVKCAGTPTSLKSNIARATADVIGEAAFGYQLNSQRDKSPNSIYNIFATLFGGNLNLFAEVPYIRQFVPLYHQRMKALAALGHHVKAIIGQKSEATAKKNWETAKSEEEDNMEERDLLDILIRSENEEGGVLTKEELADQTRTFLLAGYETSSVCILWTLIALSQHPEVQQKLFEEINGVIGKDRLPTAEDIDKMPYLFNVLRESLRFYPPIPIVFRRASKDVNLGGYNIPKNTFILINIYHMHHNSPVWVHPETFDPERWNKIDEADKSLMGSYIPFILGARNCIGSKFAMLEVRVMLAMILQKVSVELAPGQQKPKTMGRIAMVPRDDVFFVTSIRK